MFASPENVRSKQKQRLNCTSHVASEQKDIRKGVLESSTERYSEMQRRQNGQHSPDQRYKSLATLQPPVFPVLHSYGELSGGIHIDVVHTPFAV